MSADTQHLLNGTRWSNGDHTRTTDPLRDLGMRFITRRDDGDFWYVQIRVMVNGQRHQLKGRSFYDRKYGGREQARRAAVAYRDTHAYPFFDRVGYTPPDPRPRRPHVPKFRKRKEAASGPMANLHYIHLYKKDGKYNRAVLDITVNIGGRSYHSTSYSYDFAKYGGKENALRVAKADRNRLADKVHRKALELGEAGGGLSTKATHDIIKAVRIQQTPPVVQADLDRFLKRSSGNDFWIVAVRKKLWGRYYRIPNRRFFDADHGGKHRSRLEARRWAGIIDAAVSAEFDRLRQNGVTDRGRIREAIHWVMDSCDMPGTPVRSRSRIHG